MTDRINKFIFSLDDEKRNIISILRELSFSLSLGSREDIKWNALCLFKGKRAFVGIMPYKKYVSIIFDRGAELSDPNEMLEGKGKLMRHIKIYTVNDIEEKNVAHFIKESYLLK